MVTLQQALENIHSNNDVEMKKITPIITDFLVSYRGKRKIKVERKLAQEKEQVDKLQERLRSLQDNPKDDGTVNLNLSDTEKLWKNFDLQRTGVVDEICGNRNGTTDCLTDKENTSLEKIANAAFNLCAEECKNQKENLLAALIGKPVKEVSSNELDELSMEIKAFQLELESDLIPFLLENLCMRLSETDISPVVITKSKSRWTLNINESKELNGSKCEKYMKACIKICWELANHQTPAEFVWEVSGHEESFKCLTTSCMKESTCKRRVCRPAVYRDGKMISIGKYTCILCTPGNICNNSEQNESTQSEKKKIEKVPP